MWRIHVLNVLNMNVEHLGEGLVWNKCVGYECGEYVGVMVCTCVISTSKYYPRKYLPLAAWRVRRPGRGAG